MSKTKNSITQEVQSKALNDYQNYGDLYEKAKLYSPLTNIEEKWKLVPTFLKIRGLVKQHIDSFNYFTDIEIKNIVRSSRNNIKFNLCNSNNLTQRVYNTKNLNIYFIKQKFNLKNTN